MLNERFLPVIFLSLILFSAGCSKSTQSANELYVRSYKLAQDAKTAESTSYSEAARLYGEAIKAADEIVAAYPSDRLAVDILQGKARLGKYSLKELKETVAPEFERRARAEKDPVEAAAFIAESIDSPGSRVNALAILSGELVEAGQSGKAAVVSSRAFDQAQKIENGAEKNWALAEVVDAFAKAGSLKKASESLSKITDPYTKSWATSQLAIAYYGSGDKNQALSLLSQALEVAGDIESGYLRSLGVAEIAGTYAATGDTSKTIELADQALYESDDIREESKRVKVLGKIAAAYAVSGQPGQAHDVVGDIRGRENKDRALSEITRLASNLKQYGQAMNFSSAQSPASEIASITKVAARVGKTRANEAVPIIERALSLSRRLTNPQEKDWAAAQIAGASAKSGLIDKAQKLADEITDPYSKSWAFAEIASAQKKDATKAVRALMKTFELVVEIDGAPQKCEILGKTAAASKGLNMDAKMQKALHSIIQSILQH